MSETMPLLALCVYACTAWTGKTFLFYLWEALYVGEIHFAPPLKVGKHFQQLEGSFLDLVPKISIPKYLTRTFFLGGGRVLFGDIPLFYEGTLIIYISDTVLELFK
jgi:hypothetical protein